MSSPSDFVKMLLAVAGYKYQPLGQPRTIRLLTLLPLDPGSKDPNRIDATLREVPLDSKPDYEALSYVWDPWETKKSDFVFIDNQPLLVKENCHAALVHLRHASRNRVLWVDAVCIDQTSKAERTQQVQLMADIYAQADKAVEGASEASQMHLAKERYQGWTDTRKFLAYQWNPFSSLSISRWFKRAWTLQEVAFAREAVIHVGRTTLRWTTFVLAINLLQRVEDAAGQHGTICEMHSSMSMHVAVRDLVRPRETRVEPLANEITSLLSKAYTMEATIPVDRIFSLHGVLARLGLTLGPPDYDRPVEEVFTEAARLAIEHDQSLKTLNFVNGLEDRPSWPSWVPTWHVRQPSAPLKSGAWHAAGSETGPIFSFSPDGKKLRVFGRVIDSIARRSEKSPFLGQRVYGEALTMLQPYLHAEAVEAWLEWIRLWYLGLRREGGWRKYGTGPAVAYDAFYNTLLQEHSFISPNDKEKDFLDRSREGFMVWQGLFGAGVNKDGPAKRGLSMRDIRAMLPPETMRPDWVDYEHQEWDGRDKEKVLASNEWLISRAIHTNHPALCFHQNAHLRNKAKCFIMTTEGYMGTAPNSVTAGDEIILVPGLEYPLSVRPLGPGGQYHLLGPVYIQGIMRGEAWKDEPDELRAFTFV
ncbi:hypothetical protein OQA88_13482 [Cercophora sp. LCS_1]